MMTAVSGSGLLSHPLCRIGGVVNGLRAVREAMAEYAANFDAGAVAVVDLRKLVEDAAAVEKMAAAVKAAAAVCYADTEIWRRDGDRSAAHQLARLTGAGVGAAIDTLETARRLEDLPVVASAALA